MAEQPKYMAILSSYHLSANTLACCPTIRRDATKLAISQVKPVGRQFGMRKPGLTPINGWHTMAKSAPIREYRAYLKENHFAISKLADEIHARKKNYILCCMCCRSLYDLQNNFKIICHRIPLGWALSQYGIWVMFDNDLWRGGNSYVDYKNIVLRSHDRLINAYPGIEKYI